VIWLGKAVMLRKISRSDQLLPRMVSLYPAAEISICRPLHAIPTMNVSLVDCSAPTRPIYSCLSRSRAGANIRHPCRSRTRLFTLMRQDCLQSLAVAFDHMSLVCYFLRRPAFLQRQCHVLSCKRKKAHRSTKTSSYHSLTGHRIPTSL
jgi:hypothetical protein